MLGSAAVAISRHSGRLGRLRLCTPGQRVQCEPFDLRGELGLPEQVPPTLGEVVPQGSDALPRRPLAAATQANSCAQLNQRTLTPLRRGVSRTAVNRSVGLSRPHPHLPPQPSPSARKPISPVPSQRTSADAKLGTAREREPPAILSLAQGCCAVLQGGDGGREAARASQASRLQYSNLPAIQQTAGRVGAEDRLPELARRYAAIHSARSEPRSPRR